PSRIRRGDRRGGGDARARDRGYHRAGGEVRGPDRSVRGDRGSDPPRHGDGDAQLPGGPVRRRGGLRSGPGQPRSGGGVSPAQESGAWDPGPAAGGGGAGSGGGDAGAGTGRARGASGAVYRGRPSALSGGPRAALPTPGIGPPQGHEEGAIEEATAGTAG